MTLTKADIIEAIAEQDGFTLKKSKDTVETLVEIIKRNLESGEDVLLSGFGKFCVNEKKERRVWNLAAGEAMMLEARKVVTFRCSRMLRDKIND